MEEAGREKGRGGPRCAFFYQQCQLLFMRASEPCTFNGKRLFMRLCANAPASLIHMLNLFFSVWHNNDMSCEKMMSLYRMVQNKTGIFG